MMNLVSMDFDIAGRYADILRHNSFRRTWGRRKVLGLTWLLGLGLRWCDGRFDASNGEHASLLRSTLGRRVLDFGSGHGDDVRLLGALGIEADGFEPYPCDKRTGDVSRPAGLRSARALFAAVAEGRQWDTIAIATVLNSVPFAADRRHIVRIAASLMGPTSKLLAMSISTKGVVWEAANGRALLNGRTHEFATFRLEYEPGISLGELGASGMPKVQKYHTADEYAELFGEFFESVDCRWGPSTNVSAVCSRPKPIDQRRLWESLAFEFGELPYPTGGPMGLAAEARAAWESRAAARC